MINKSSHRVFNDIILNYFELYSFQLLQYNHIIFPIYLIFYPWLYYLASYLRPYKLIYNFAFSFTRRFVRPAYRSSRAINRSLPILNSPYRGVCDAFAAALLVRSHRHLSTHGKAACHQSRSDKRLSRCTLVGETDVGGSRCAVKALAYVNGDAFFRHNGRMTRMSSPTDDRVSHGAS